VGVELAEVVVDAGDVGDVLLGGLAVLAGLHVDHADAFAEVGEGHAARLYDDVVLRVASAQRVPAGRGADGVLHHVRRDAHHACVAVDAAAAVLEDVERLVVLDEDAGALEDLERREMDLVELGFREDVDAQAAAAVAAGVQVAFHSAPPGVGGRSTSRFDRGLVSCLTN
jgi:hypothetical protein